MVFRRDWEIGGGLRGRWRCDEAL